MNSSERSLIPLQQANLCLDCDMITTGHTYCFGCGSTALLNLARTLDNRDYADSLPDALADVASISAAAGLDADDGQKSGCVSQFAAVSAPSLQMFQEADWNEADDHRWSSLRGVAAVVQRAITGRVRSRHLESVCERAALVPSAIGERRIS